MTSIENAFECIEFITNTPPSLIILDDNLPLMNGSYFIQYLLKEDKYISTHIILFLENFTEDNIQKFKELGIKNIIQKPVDESTLVNSIRQLTDKFS